MNHHHLSYILHDLPGPSAPRHRGPVLPPPPSTVYAPSASASTSHYTHHHHRMDWRAQAPLYSALFAAPLAPSSWTNAGPSAAAAAPAVFWPPSPPDFLLPFHHYPAKEYDADAPYPVARSDTSSATSRDSDASPAPTPAVAAVVCNAPLVAPVPLPYHSPTFLMYDLPDEDEDLSHPPYTHRPHKRKRARDAEDDGEEEADGEAPAKRRADGAARGAAAMEVRLRHPAAGFSRRNRAR
ncbi:hypothetical protein OH77DRAFT_9804 [Trametes cingulata]|nr:hypothetical protein OH77DRAFT_9804 [Trametes cingulata]